MERRHKQIEIQNGPPVKENHMYIINEAGAYAEYLCESMTAPFIHNVYDIVQDKGI